MRFSFKAKGLSGNVGSFCFLVGEMEENKVLIEELERSKHFRKCDMCKKNFDAYHLTVDYPYIPPDFIYDDAEITISFGKRGNEKVVTLNMCPEYTEKLLELLDKHFPRLNLEDRL